MEIFDVIMPGKQDCINEKLCHINEQLDFNKRTNVLVEGNRISVIFITQIWSREWKTIG